MIHIEQEMSWASPPVAPTRVTTGGAAVSPELTVIAETLKLNAGQWALIARTERYGQASAFSHRVNKAVSKAFAPAGTFEARAARLDGETELSAVYVRYLGPDGDPARNLAGVTDRPQLRELAQQRGLTVTGTKREIATRIVEFDSMQVQLPLAEPVSV
jgi:hypothetical protein